MARSIGGEGPDLIQELLSNPHEFEFFQAVRLIEQFVAHSRRHPTPAFVGSSAGPHREPIRFRALPSLSFPPGQVAALKSQNDVSEDAPTADRLPVDMTVSFLGLTGPAGVLPQHYTTLLIARAHQQKKDHTLREFFDLFNHRAVSFFFRAWEKYRLPFLYERSLTDDNFEDDQFSQCLFSLVGLNTPGLRYRFSFDDQAIARYGGLLAQQCRNATGLQEMLSDYFELPVEIEQFVGQWLYLRPDLQSAFPSRRHPQGLNMKLGESAVVGSKAWDVESRIRIRLGPLSIDDFRRLIFGAEFRQAIAELIRFYVGHSIDFDLQLILRKEDVPPFQLASAGSYEPRLGWNTWLGQTDRFEDADDAVFRIGSETSFGDESG